MSDAAGSDQDPLDEAAKIEKYSYLMPAASAQVLAKMASNIPGDVASADGAPADGAPVDGAPADGAPADGAPPEAAPATPRLPEPVWPDLSCAAARDRALGCFLGLAVGDAVGTTLEFTARDSVPPLTDMVGGGPFSLAPGEWTDDTTMALCLAETLVAEDTVDQDDFMRRLRGWLERGENTVPGRCFDIGLTTRAAIEWFAATGFAAAGSIAPDSAGNACLARLAPLAIRFAADPDLAALQAQKQSRTTHGAMECLDACKLFVAQLIDALNGADKDAATRQRVMGLSPHLLFISAGEWRQKTREQIRSSGYVVHTLEAALWAVWQADNFRDTVLVAANLGDDADSVAAVAGQLAGALYGASGIPPEWLARLAWRERIEALAQTLFDASGR